MTYPFEAKSSALGMKRACAETSAMIKLTRLDGELFVLNADLIRYIESRPDTFITLTSGDRLVVAESMDDVLERAVRYQQTKYMIPPPHREPPRETAQVERVG